MLSMEITKLSAFITILMCNTYFSFYTYCKYRYNLYDPIILLVLKNR